VGTDKAAITTHALELLINAAAYDAMARAVNPFGDGKASDRIRSVVRAYFETSGNALPTA
jgi:UDP-N-acetylglucosamine 2-epimerase (non-hydrolysing)